MKSMADLEAEMLYGARPQGPPLSMVAQTATPTPVLMERSGQMGHVNPAIHNLTYPGMRDRHANPAQHQQPTRNNNNNMMSKPSPTGRNQNDGQYHHQQGHDNRRSDQFGERRNDHFRNDRRPDQFNERRNDQFFDRRNDHYDRRNDRDNLHR